MDTHTHTNTHLASIYTDDAIAVTCAVVKIGDGDSLLAGGDPVLLGSWVNLEDVGPGGVDRLLPGEQRTGDTEKWRISCNNIHLSLRHIFTAQLLCIC